MKKAIIYTILLCMTLGFVPATYAQRIRFLPHKLQEMVKGTVNELLQDRDGYLWIGTHAGLLRYDGTELKAYQPDVSDPRSLSDGFITAIYEDSRGDIYVGTRNGCNRLQKGHEGFTRFYPERDKMEVHGNRVQCISEDGGHLWIGTGNGLYKVARDSFGGPAMRYAANGTLPSPDIKCIARDSRNNILVSTAQGIVYKTREQREFSKPDFTTTDANNEAMLLKGDTLFAGGYKGLDVIDLRTGRLVNLRVHGTGMVNEVKSIRSDGNGNLWMGTGNGLWVIKGGLYDSSHTQWYVHHTDDPYSLPLGEALALCADAEGNMWVGCDAGIAMYSPATSLFDYVDAPTDSARVLVANDVWSLLEDSEGEIWTGTMSGISRVLVKDPGSKGPLSANIRQVIHYRQDDPEKLASDKIHALQELPNGAIVAATSKGLCIFNKQDNRFRTLKAPGTTILPRLGYIAMTPDEKGVYFASDTAIYLLDTGGQTITNVSFHPHFPDTRLTNIYAEHGRLWVCTDQGLYRINPDGTQQSWVRHPGKKNSLALNVISNVYKDSRGRTWIATFGGGIDLMDERADTFRHFTLANGLASNLVYGMVEDSAGNLWMSTSKGVCRLDTRRMQFSAYNLQSGILHPDFMQNSLLRGKSGRIYFGSYGILSFRPEAFTEQRHSPPVVLSALSLNYNAAGDSAIYVLNKGGALELGYTNRIISLHFSCLSFTDPTRVKYSYRLEGFDTVWTTVDWEHCFVTFTNLAAGTYRFAVRADINGQEAKPLYMNITIHPPYWATWWFRLLAVAAFSGALASVIYYFSRQKLVRRLRAAELDNKLQAERVRISRDLHDNLGSQLTYIISNLELIGQQTQDQRSIQEKVEALEDYSRSMMLQFRRSIWTLNKETFTSAEFETKLAEYSRQYLKNFTKPQLTWNASIQNGGQLKPTQALYLFRIMQEVITNTVKYAEANNLVVKVSATSSAFAISIQDDGRGFTSNEATAGMGIRNMRQRVEELKGSFNISSQPEAGTSIQISIPL